MNDMTDDIHFFQLQNTDTLHHLHVGFDQIYGLVFQVSGLYLKKE